MCDFLTFQFLKKKKLAQNVLRVDEVSKRVQKRKYKGGGCMFVLLNVTLFLERPKLVSCDSVIQPKTKTDDHTTVQFELRISPNRQSQRLFIHMSVFVEINVCGGYSIIPLDFKLFTMFNVCQQLLFDIMYRTVNTFQHQF